jgi:hypothetical protein
MAGSGVVLGYLKYVLGFDSLAFQEGLGDADKRLKAAQRSLAKTADKFSSIGTVLSVGITAPFTALVASSIPAAKESAIAVGQVQAALTSMGDAAGKTLPQLQAQAKAIQNLSTFDDDDIMRKVTANLLTFGNVAKEQFDRAQLAAVNLSARLGQDLQSSAIQVGKALNDPIKGITALSRVGVSFTAQQQEQIKAMTAAGDVAGAQGIILGELERQYGGAAKALREATPGIESQQAWADFQETVGAIALKVLPPLSRMLTAVLNGFNSLSPGMQTFVVGATAVVAVIGPIALGISGLITAFGAVLPAITVAGTALATMGAIITGTVIPAIGAVIVALSPILLPLAAVAAAVAAVYLAWRNWDTIGPIIEKAIIWVIKLHDGVKKYLQDALLSVFNWLGAKLKWVGDQFFKLYDAVVGHSYIPDMVDGIGEHMARLEGNMVAPAQSAAEKVGAAFAQLGNKIEATNDNVARNIEATVRSVGSAVQGFASALKSGDFLDILGAGVQAGVSIYGAANGGGSFGGFRAAGGPVSAGSTYMVGERGPEMFTARRSGYIHPNNDNRGASSRPIVIAVEEGALFRPVVRGEAANVSIVTVGASNRASAKRQTRRLA